METVTGQPLKSEVLQLAEMIVALCGGHTATTAIAATEVAGKVIASDLYSSQSSEARP